MGMIKRENSQARNDAAPSTEGYGEAFAEARQTRQTERQQLGYIFSTHYGQARGETSSAVRNLYLLRDETAPQEQWRSRGKGVRRLIIWGSCYFIFSLFYIMLHG